MSLYKLHSNFHQQSIHQNDSDDDHEQQHGQSNIKQLHGFLMLVSWFFLLHIGLWAHYFKSYRYAILIHIICMSLIVVLTAIACTAMLAVEGKQVIYESFFHQTIGFYLVVGLLPITIINGGLAKIFMNTYKIQTMWMLTTKQIHKILGWVLLILVKIPLATGLAEDQQEIMAFILMLDGISYGLFWYFKINKATVGVTVNQEFKKVQNVRREIGNIDYYFNSLYGKCFIFANYIYPIQSVINAHPGGNKFILKIRNRQIDRFIYGMELTQDETCKFTYRHAHSSNFLNLAQKPITKIGIQQPFFQLKQSNSVQIYNIYTSQNKKMFLIYLKVKTVQQLQRDGYKSFNQFGRYYALSFNGTTRLFTSVYFLLPKNVKWMESLINDKAKKYKKYRKQNLKKQQNMIELQQSLLDSVLQTKQLYIPLFLKRYDNGMLTSHLLTQFKQPEQTSMTLSCCRGFGIGLNFQEMDYKNQRIVMLAAGTGLNPYCDLIDILFKKMLIERKEQNFEKIQKFSPILEKYVLYIGIESLQCIHPITLFQLQQLSKNDYIQCYLKSKNYEHSIKGDTKIKSQQKIPYSSIRYLPLTYRFEEAVQKQFQMDEDVKLYICGTPELVKNILQKLTELQVPEAQYRII